VTIDKMNPLREALAGLRASSAARPPVGLPSAELGEARGPALRRRLNQAVAQIAADDPSRRWRGLRAIVLVSLVREFGDALQGDPAFQSMVERVTQAMHEEPGLRESIDSALHELRSDISWT
jgi:hypothetical protein